MDISIRLSAASEGGVRKYLGVETYRRCIRLIQITHLFSSAHPTCRHCSVAAQDVQSPMHPYRRLLNAVRDFISRRINIAYAIQGRRKRAGLWPRCVLRVKFCINLPLTAPLQMFVEFTAGVNRANLDVIGPACLRGLTD